MAFFLGGQDALVIVMDHCRESGQKFSLRPLEKDPRDEKDMEYVKWGHLNHNWIGRLHPGDKILWQDNMDVFWYVELYPEPRTVDKTGLEIVKGLMGDD
jgi:hypothetical protein